MIININSSKSYINYFDSIKNEINRGVFVWSDVRIESHMRRFYCQEISMFAKSSNENQSRSLRST